ncbi:MAG: 1,4-alpha-glucan branching protein domain-containing protein [Candidatus Nanopelagicales bacterium]
MTARAGQRDSAPISGPEIGTFCLVLHSHLPWVAHHGTWPVGEEWLHQAWADSYARVFDIATRLSDEGRHNLFTLGLTPVLAAALDDPYCLAEHHRWLADRQWRAIGLLNHSGIEYRKAAEREIAHAHRSLALFEKSWQHGASPLLRHLLDADAIELLGGPLTHTFTPYIPEKLATPSLMTGLDDMQLRLGARPTGIWLPECAYVPDLDVSLSRANVGHLMLEGPTLQAVGANTSAAWQLGDTDVRVVGRDLPITYRVWSPKSGYPGNRWYRDFHAFERNSGLRLYRVTGRQVSAEQKNPYNESRALAQVERDAQDFVSRVRQRLLDISRNNDGTPGIVVAAFDTELFGHWWHEGPIWLEQVLRLLPTAGIRVSTINDAITRHGVTGTVRPEAGSWGSGKDFRVWSGEATTELRAQYDSTTKQVMHLLAEQRIGQGIKTRNLLSDQLITSLLLALSSDWVFLIEKAGAAQYASERAAAHLADVRQLIDASSAGRGDDSDWVRIAQRDGIWGHLDARRFG